MRAPVLPQHVRANTSEVRRLAWFAAAVVASSLATDVSAQSKAKPDLSPTAAAYTLEAPSLVMPQSVPSLTRDEEDPQADFPAIEDPELPGLERRADGSYRFQGTNFRASISKDGQVSFKDTYVGLSRKMKPLPPPPADKDPTPTGARHAQSTPWLALQLHIDLQGYLEKLLGNDPYLAERRWFMERTRALRESLANRAVTKALRGTLLKIWSDAGLSLSARKRETFELWNRSSDDERGALVRKLVQAFVRERCPLHSSCEFHPSELERFNDQRLIKEAFAPYAAPTRPQTARPPQDASAVAQ